MGRGMKLVRCGLCSRPAGTARPARSRPQRRSVPEEVLSTIASYEDRSGRVPGDDNEAGARSPAPYSRLCPAGLLDAPSRYDRGPTAVRSVHTRVTRRCIACQTLVTGSCEYTHGSSRKISAGSCWVKRHSAIAVAPATDRAPDFHATQPADSARTSRPRGDRNASEPWPCLGRSASPRSFIAQRTRFGRIGCQGAAATCERGRVGACARRERAERPCSMRAADRTPRHPSTRFRMLTHGEKSSGAAMG
jgi:hypothetical protein